MPAGRRTHLAVLAALVCAAAIFLFVRHAERPRPLILTNQQLDIPADGNLHRIATIALPRGVSAADIRTDGIIAAAPSNAADLLIQSPVTAGTRNLRIAYQGRTTTLHLRVVPSATDTVGNGTPDLLRLHTASDRAAFRGWFTALADAAVDLPATRLPPEINDCAALLRWCYRNALHAHNEAWLRDAPRTLDLSGPSVRQYIYPETPLGAALFRVRPGAFSPGYETNGAFAQFADARTLWQRNTFPLSRDVRSARPGDLLFFRQLEQNSPYHSMIVTGRAQQAVVYHTGPIGRGPGEMRRVLLDDLLHHPDPRWRPVADNSNFLGVYRWNILQEDPR